jgi:hypothetical protein
MTLVRREPIEEITAWPGSDDVFGGIDRGVAMACCGESRS